ncbi:MAG TPA: DUF885 domain-containing protein [Candidatus Limnocylindrales bacterium]|nr:DUF885 domain-containing protein [Candidatus Limnocylindrales bacterium]
MTAFDELAREFIAESFRLDPLEATNAGVHDHDARWPDWSSDGIAARLVFVERWRSRLEAIPPGDLTADESIDRDRLLLELGDRAYEAHFAADAWDPMTWVYRLGDGLFTLLAREFAPPAARLASFAGRLEGIPGVVEAASGRLTSGAAGVPVSRFHADIALLNLAGIEDLIAEGLGLAGANEADAAVERLRPRLDAAAATGRAALDELRDFLRHVVLPAAEGEGRLGQARFAERLAHAFSDPTMTPERVLASAEAQYPLVRAEMARLARELWPSWCGDREMPAGDDEVVREVLSAVVIDHPPADRLLETCREELARIETFCRARGVIGLSDEPLQIQWTPRFLRNFAGAMLHSPGAFDRGQKAFYSITPPNESWPPERVESFLREHHRRQLTLLTIHEAVPGHYLQGVYGNRAPSIVRQVYGDGPYAEGWAVYVTQVMLDLGFGADDPTLWLAHWKYYLRAIVNAIIDVRIHTLGMTSDEAIALMVDGAWQEEAEARGKYDRARLTSTQLSTYFIGSMAMWDIEAQARRHAAVAAGAGGGSAVRAGPIVGGYGATPGFNYRAHLESIISGGKLPLPLLRRALNLPG